MDSASLSINTTSMDGSLSIPSNIPQATLLSDAIDQNSQLTQNDPTHSILRPRGNSVTVTVTPSQTAAASVDASGRAPSTIAPTSTSDSATPSDPIYCPPGANPCGVWGATVKSCDDCGLYTCVQDGHTFRIMLYGENADGTPQYTFVSGPVKGCPAIPDVSHPTSPPAGAAEPGTTTTSHVGKKVAAGVAMAVVLFVAANAPI